MSYTDLDITDDIIDTRDLVEYVEQYETSRTDDPDHDPDDWDERLLELAKECEQYADDYLHGATVVADSYFVQYAKDFADDIGAINREAGWPACHIDWDAAADSLKEDFTEVEAGGYTFYVR